MANNNQALFKTTLEGEVLWSVYNRPNTDASKTKKNSTTHCKFGAPNGYCPTWFEHQPGSQYLYMSDGYGSNKQYIYTVDGKFTGTSVGGTGGPDQHGKFNIAHSISWDPRRGQMAVSDRVNHRLEYFDIDANDPTKFDYVSTTMQDFAKPNTGLVCNVRFLNDTWAITPTLEGPVFIMDKENKLLSTVSNVPRPLPSVPSTPTPVRTGIGSTRVRSALAFLRRPAALEHQAHCLSLCAGCRLMSMRSSARAAPSKASTTRTMRSSCPTATSWSPPGTRVGLATSPCKSK